MSLIPFMIGMMFIVALVSGEYLKDPRPVVLWYTAIGLMLMIMAYLREAMRREKQIFYDRFNQGYLIGYLKGWNSRIFLKRAEQLAEANAISEKIKSPEET